MLHSTDWGLIFLWQNGHQEYEKEKPYERVRFMYTKNLSPQGHDIAPV